MAHLCSVLYVTYFILLLCSAGFANWEFVLLTVAFVFIIWVSLCGPFAPYQEVVYVRLIKVGAR